MKDFVVRGILLPDKEEGYCSPSAYYRTPDLHGCLPPHAWREPR